MDYCPLPLAWTSCSPKVLAAELKFPRLRPRGHRKEGTFWHSYHSPPSGFCRGAGEAHESLQELVRAAG